MLKLDINYLMQEIATAAHTHMCTHEIKRFPVACAATARFQFWMITLFLSLCSMCVLVFVLWIVSHELTFSIDMKSHSIYIAHAIAISSFHDWIKRKKKKKSVEIPKRKGSTCDSVTLSDVHYKNTNGINRTDWTLKECQLKVKLSNLILTNCTRAIARI